MKKQRIFVRFIDVRGRVHELPDIAEAISVTGLVPREGELLVANANGTRVVDGITGSTKVLAFAASFTVDMVIRNPEERVISIQLKRDAGDDYHVIEYP